MANRGNHYEAAFEAYLRDHKVPYVAVDEARRSLLPEGDSLKSLDFIVSSSKRISWLVDVKGRRFPSGDHSKQYWRNWSTQDDLKSLRRWESTFGAGFQSLFVFAYNIVGDKSPLPEDQLFVYRDLLYGFVGIRLTDYLKSFRLISPAWDTVAMSGTEFRRLARPIEFFL